MKNEVKQFAGGVSVDDRGSVRFVNDFNFSGVKRFYHIENHARGFIRAWHGHLIEGKYVYVAHGTALVGVGHIMAQDGEIKAGELLWRGVLSSASPKVLWIPPGNANGFQSLEEDTSIMFFSTSSLEDSKLDDFRLPYNQWNIWEVDYR